MRSFHVLLFMCLAISASVRLQAATIGVSIASLHDPFLARVAIGVREEALNKGINFTITSAINDPQFQLQHIRSFIDKKVDAIIVNIVDVSTSEVITQMAQRAGIPLVFVNRVPGDIKSLPKGVVFVGPNEINSGTLQIREACDMMMWRGNIVIVSGPLDQETARIRTLDIDNELKRPRCGQLKVVGRITSDWSRDNAREKLSEWLDYNVKFDAILANNDEMALGAIEALKEAGIPKNKVIVAGIDGTKAALMALSAGELDLTVYQNSQDQGKEAVAAAVKMINSIYVRQKVWIPFNLVTPANVDQYLKL